MPADVPPDAPEVRIGPLAGPEDARAFRLLNEGWIGELFTLEEHDEVLLGDPQGTIIDLGGVVLVAREGDDVVGCVALLPADPSRYELAKMAVAPSHRRRGLGRALAVAALEAARERGAEVVFLATARKLTSARALYASLGFAEAGLADLGLEAYPAVRADTFMILRLA